MRRRPGVFWGLLFVVVIVNLPLVHSSWQDFRLSRDGVMTSAEVIQAVELTPNDDPRYQVKFRFNAEIDPQGHEWAVDVNRAVYDTARADKVIDVRVRPARPATFEVPGEVDSGASWAVFLIVDLMLALLIVLLWRAGRLRRWADDHAEDPVSDDGTAGDYPDQSRPF